MEKERYKQAQSVAEALSKDSGIPTDIFRAKTIEFRRQYEEAVDTERMMLSDENDEVEPDTFSDKEKELFNSKILGYSKDYSDEIVDIQHQN